jgi:NTE family protein
MGVSISGLVRGLRVFSRELSGRTNGPQQRLKLGVALGGGFARGIAHVGVLKVLEEENIPVDYVAGTSVGAIIGAGYCSGMTAAELKEVACAVRLRDFARLTLSRCGFYNSDRMVRLFARVLKCQTFEELKIPLAIVATEFRTGEAVVFRKGALADPIRASCAYPGMFLPVKIGGRSYIDGMLAYGVPTTPLRKMGADCVIGCYLSAHLNNVRPPRHIFEVIGQCFSIAQSKLSDSWLRDADLVIEPNVAGFSYDCFERTPELIAAGEATMRAKLPELLELLKAPRVDSMPKPGIAPRVAPTTSPAG